MPELRVALFVEGSHSVPPARGLPPLIRIWREHLRDALGLRTVDVIEPISKKHLVAMDPAHPPMSGAGESLDQLMARVMKRTPYDAAVIAWDLVPAWNPTGTFCRWDETLRLYRFLSRSEYLPEQPWKRKARERLEALRRRPTPGERVGVPVLSPGAVLPVCMEPMFEVLLVQSDAALRRALGVQNQQIAGWPRHGWGDPDERRPDSNVLARAVRAIRRIRPRLDVVKQIRGDMRTMKNEWEEYLLRQMLTDPAARTAIVSQPLSRRLVELLDARR